MSREARIHDVEKVVSSISGVEKTKQLMKNNEIRAFFYTMHKNKLKMAERLKCKTGHYQTPGRELRQNIL